jgi:TadE-like protein
MSQIVRRRGHERSRSNGEEGQTLVEFALILPLLLIVLLGIIDLGKAFGYKNDLTNLANQAARAAAVNKCPGPSPCTSIESWIRNQAPPGELKNGGGSITGTGLQAGSAIRFTFTDPGAPNYCVGDPVAATVKVHYNWLNFLKLSGVLPSLGTDITGSATVRLEKTYEVPPQGDPALNVYSASNIHPATCPT